MTSELVEQVATTCASAAAMAATAMLQHDKPIGYATLESDGVENGIVVVCLTPAEARAMRAYIASRGGGVVLGRPA